MKKDNRQLPCNIDAIAPCESFYNLTNCKWGSVLKEITPLGIIAESYAKTLAYKIETKRLDVEITRIKEQSKIFHNMLDNNFKLKMEELRQRRISLMCFHETVDTELHQLHIERETVLEMAQLSQQKAFEPGLSMEERQLHKEMTLELTRQLPGFGGKANETLQKLVQALPPVEISPCLIEE